MEGGPQVPSLPPQNPGLGLAQGSARPRRRPQNAADGLCAGSCCPNARKYHDGLERGSVPYNGSVTMKYLCKSASLCAEHSVSLSRVSRGDDSSGRGSGGRIIVDGLDSPLWNVYYRRNFSYRGHARPVYWWLLMDGTVGLWGYGIPMPALRSVILCSPLQLGGLPSFQSRRPTRCLAS